MRVIFMNPILPVLVLPLAVDFVEKDKEDLFVVFEEGLGGHDLVFQWCWRNG